MVVPAFHLLHLLRLWNYNIVLYFLLLGKCLYTSVSSCKQVSASIGKCL